MRSFLINKNPSLDYRLKKRIERSGAFSMANTIKKVILIFWGRTGRGKNMVAYEFYWRDETGKEHFIGILPERREKPERITEESVLNWAWKIIGDNSNVKDIYFVKIDV